MKDLFKKYGHGLFALYIFIYLPWFFYLEGLNLDYHVIHCFVDDLIPFNELFIIPYVLWFFYIVASCIYLFFKAERGNFLKFAIALTGGMTMSMFIFMIYPSQVTMRPTIDAATSIFGDAVLRLYLIDTSTNVFPSIHVYNSIVACVALEKNRYFHRFKMLRVLNYVLCISICLSTMFLKQHSFLDVVAGIVLYLIFYLVLYVPKWKIFSSKYILIP